MNEVYQTRKRGVPQDCSLSLFLSNIAAHELDVELERLNGSFARYADDVVAITQNFSDALAVSDVFKKHCSKAGLAINYDKSPGILFFGSDRGGEVRTFAVDKDDGRPLRTERAIDYLGHSISIDGIKLPEKSVWRIKRRISKIIYNHLFLYRRLDVSHNGRMVRSINQDRIGRSYFDWDLVTCINEIRRYIYGGNKETEISSFLTNKTSPPQMRGLMAFFPLHSELEQLTELDVCLLNVIKRAQSARSKMLLTRFKVNQRKLSKSEILDGTWYKFSEIDQETTLPSFVRASRAAHKYYTRFGLAGIQAPKYYSLLSY